FWPVYEVAYILALIVIVAVFAAAAGAVGSAILGWPPIVGALALMALIAVAAAWGNESVERLFKYVSVLLYGTYAAFVVFAFTPVGFRILTACSTPVPTPVRAVVGLSYAGFIVFGASVSLPVVRLLSSSRDAVLAGAIAGPLAMIPALLFFICMAGFYPSIQA